MPQLANYRQNFSDRAVYHKPKEYIYNVEMSSHKNVIMTLRHIYLKDNPGNLLVRLMSP